jgi:hypothetical protein
VLFNSSCDLSLIYLFIRLICRQANTQKNVVQYQLLALPPAGDHGATRKITAHGKMAGFEKRLQGMRHA